MAVILDLPDIRQRDPHDCGPAAVESLLRFHGVTPARWLARLANPVQGMNPDTIEAVLWDALGRVLRGSMDVDTLRHLTRLGRPVLCPVTSEGEGHWVLVGGIERGWVYYQCPIRGLTSERVDRWSESWHDSVASVPFHSFGICGWLV